MAKPARKTAILALRVTPEVRAALDKAAARERRSVAGLAEFAIALGLEKEGYLPKPPKSK